MTAPMHGSDEGTVIPLRRPGQAPRLFGDEDAVERSDELEVLEGEIVEDDAEWDDLPVLHRAAVVVREAATGDAARTAARQVSYLVVGASVARRRWKDARGGRYERMMAAAEAAGDHEAVLKWAELAAQAHADRHARRMDRAQNLGKHVERLPLYAKGTAGTMGGIGVLMAVAEKDATMVAAPFLAVADLVQWAIHMAVILWGPALVTAPIVALLALWATGRSNLDASNIAWVQALNPAAEDDEAPITPSIVVTALRDLGIPALRKAVEAMGDAGAGMLSPIRIAGCGVEVDVTLPSGVSTEEVAKKRRKLAENMARHEYELFITIPAKARTVRLWIADSGALDEPIGPSPLVTGTSIRADYYRGRAPWGQTLRGDAATVSVFQQHVLITGKSNQGKTASLRALALWLALDPTVEFRIADLKGVGDWRMFEGIATELTQGPADEHIMAATHMVEDAVEEMNRRIEALQDSGAEEGVTREMARAAGSGFHPLVVIVDEAQKAYMATHIKDDADNPYGGKSARSRYFRAVRELHNQGRAVNVTLWQGTQDPTDENLPKVAREGAHLRLALFLPTESQAKMALGEAPVEQGAAPHKLRDGIDLGTVVAVGPGVEIPRGEPSVTIRTHFVSGKDAAAVAERAKKLRGRITTREGQAEKAAPRSLLADLDEVLMGRGDGEVRISHLPALLSEHAPDHEPYRKITGEQIAATLKGYDIKVTKTGNVWRLMPADFRAGFARVVTEDFNQE
ncbi:FtsK/SpoIIIE domain-containing protein [Actinocorallia sp. B10E7]|uniref:FtsK/SpoIIIE domain-containing protein n=1 Tax=Actinocorallia sp. B10E7 TaxID=3153558 RepID=UPI00325F3362